MKRRTFLALTLTAVGLKLGPRPSKWATPTPTAMLPPIPSGFIMPYNVPRPPPRDWLVCDGRMLRRRDYPALAAVLGRAYGGDARRFKLPDLRGRDRGPRPPDVSRRVWDSWNVSWIIKA